MQAFNSEEPEILTFYGVPVSLVEEPYPHIGVIQVSRKQSAVASAHRISKGVETSYLLQDVTKNALKGISPLSNRHVFMCYHGPTFVYGLDTIHMNKIDIERLEQKYRAELKRLQSLPCHTSSAIVYLAIGILPAEASRDLEILGLLGQVAMCCTELQNVTKIIQNNLEDYDVNFPGWSGLARITTQKYSLPDPLEYMMHPWTSKGWRQMCKSTIVDYWDKKLRLKASSMDSLYFCDSSELSVSKIHRIWEYAGLSSIEVPKAAVNMWFLLGVYHCNSLLLKMKKSRSDRCHCSSDAIEDISHITLFCKSYDDIRIPFLSNLTLQNPNLLAFCDQPEMITRTILDPESPRLPAEIKHNWKSIHEAYQLTRNYLFNLDRKRRKIIENIGDPPKFS